MRFWAEDLLHFWFHKLGPGDWFGSSPEVDRELRRRFGGWLESLANQRPQSFLTNTRTARAAVLLFALHGERAAAPRGTGWLASMGRLSYEIYLTHMFVVFAAVALYRHFERNPWFGFLWYAPVVALCWLLGAALAHGWSIPCDRALRRRWLARAQSAPAPAATVIPR